MKPTLLPSHPPSPSQLAGATAITAVVLLAIAMWTQMRMQGQLLPHSFCIQGSQPLLLLHLTSDALIALAYLLIPWAMIRFVQRRRDVPFGWVAWVFGAFIVACGLTHAMEVWTLWYPVYWYAGVAKAFTAAVSLGTAWLIYRLTPEALRLPSAQQLRELNASLTREIQSREAAQRELAQAKRQVEELLALQTTKADQMSAVLDSFFDEAPIGLALLDEEKRYVRANPALLAMTGRHAEEYIGLGVEEVSHMPRAVIDAVDQVWRTRGTLTGVEVIRSDAAGTRHWVGNYFAVPTRAPAPMIGAIVQDVTREREIERQRAEALASAETANRTKDEFLAKVSHELRSPLQVATSSAEALRRLPGMPEQASKAVVRLHDAIRQQARMINDLLDVSRILSGRLEVVSEPLDPSALLLKVLEDWSAVPDSRRIRLHFEEVRAGEALVVADPARLEQIFTNLLDNAVRFSAVEGDVSVRSHVERGRWRLSVRDRGVGLEQHELEAVFKPFVQGGVQPVNAKGLGLGLAIVASLVEMLGGRVWAESEGRGTGATFVVELPLAASGEGAPHASGPARREAARLDGLSLLYVEDDVDVLYAMRDGLSALGAQVTVAASYEEAMAALARSRFAAVVTDLDLGPGPGGHAVAAAARADPGHSQARVIAVSAFGTAEDCNLTAEAGFAMHLVKPVSAEDVARAVAAPKG